MSTLSSVPVYSFNPAGLDTAVHLPDEGSFLASSLSWRTGWRTADALRASVKRAVDLAGALLGLFLLWPVMLAIAVWIRRESPGPVLFRQVRRGHRGRPFRMLKFRTMVADAEARLGELESCNESAGGVLFKLRHDPRVTRLGRFLRRSSLDELPQLLNVLKGEMSLVGPALPWLPPDFAGRRHGHDCVSGGLLAPVRD